MALLDVHGYEHVQTKGFSPSGDIQTACGLYMLGRDVRNVTNFTGYRCLVCFPEAGRQQAKNALDEIFGR